jgi:hypothetical protein
VTAITFRDDDGNEWTLVWRRPEGPLREATAEDLSLAGYTPSAENAEVQRLLMACAKRTRELEALRALETRLRSATDQITHPLREDLAPLLKAIDEARKG